MAIAVILGVWMAAQAAATFTCAGELLYNGICLPKPWPPRRNLSHADTAPPLATVAGWDVLLDPATGCEYFYRPDTGASTWDPPAGLSAPQLPPPHHRRKTARSRVPRTSSR